MKTILLCTFPIFFLLTLSGCTSTTTAPTTVGQGYTFRDLRQHTYDKSRDIENTWVTLSPDGETMAYVRTQKGNEDIFMKSVNARAMTQKTFHAANDSYPSFSPKGDKIAFASTRNGNWDIFVMNTDQSKAKRQITFSNDPEIAPSWSPDGTKLAFCRLSRISGKWEIWTFDLKNGALTSLVPGKFPKYHPEEETLLFQRPSSTQGWYELWTIDGLGRAETTLLSSQEEGYITPDWSPDGSRIVFTSGGKEQRAETINVEKIGRYVQTDALNTQRKANDVWTINRYGNELTQLTAHPAEDWSPVWSSDGRIYFISKRDKHHNIWSAIPEFVELDILP